MRVLLLGRSGIFDALGGDRIQIENTAKELRKKKIRVDIETGLRVDYAPYDIVHIFQLDWNPESYFHAKKAKSLSKPVVLSPIHHNVEEVTRFDNEYVFDFRRVSKLLFKDQFHRDVFKDVYRTLFDLKKLYTTLASLLMGLKQMHKRTLELSDIVLVQTEQEALDLQDTFGVEIEHRQVINGVAPQFLRSSEFVNTLGFSDYILCVGRIEPRKNQLSIISAVEKLRKNLQKDIRLVFIGRKSGMKHFEYNWKFDKQLRSFSWIKHINTVPYEDIPSFYRFAKVCVSASWFETTGLTSLEALLLGTNAVAAGARAKEYLGDNASYCDPGDVLSIEKALKKEYLAPRPKIDEAVKKNYTWEMAAEKTLEVYQDLVNGRITWRRSER